MSNVLGRFIRPAGFTQRALDDDDDNIGGGFKFNLIDKIAQDATPRRKDDTSTSQRDKQRRMSGKLAEARALTTPDRALNQEIAKGWHFKKTDGSEYTEEEMLELRSRLEENGYGRLFSTWEDDTGMRYGGNADMDYYKEKGMVRLTDSDTGALLNLDENSKMDIIDKQTGEIITSVYKYLNPHDFLKGQGIVKKITIQNWRSRLEDLGIYSRDTLDRAEAILTLGNVENTVLFDYAQNLTIKNLDTNSVIALQDYVFNLTSPGKVDKSKIDKHIGDINAAKIDQHDVYTKQSIKYGPKGTTVTIGETTKQGDDIGGEQRGLTYNDLENKIYQIDPVHGSSFLGTKKRDIKVSNSFVSDSSINEGLKKVKKEIVDYSQATLHSVNPRMQDKFISDIVKTRDAGGTEFLGGGNRGVVIASAAQYNIDGQNMVVDVTTTDGAALAENVIGWMASNGMIAYDPKEFNRLGTEDQHSYKVMAMSYYNAIIAPEYRAMVEAIPDAELRTIRAYYKSIEPTLDMVRNLRNREKFGYENAIDDDEYITRVLSETLRSDRPLFRDGADNSRIYDVLRAMANMPHRNRETYLRSMLNGNRDNTGKTITEPILTEDGFRLAHDVIRRVSDLTKEDITTLNTLENSLGINLKRGEQQQTIGAGYQATIGDKVAFMQTNTRTSWGNYYADLGFDGKEFVIMDQSKASISPIDTQKKLTTVKVMDVALDNIQRNLHEHMLDLPTHIRENRNINQQKAMEAVITEFIFSPKKSAASVADSLSKTLKLQGKDGIITEEDVHTARAALSGYRGMDEWEELINSHKVLKDNIYTPVQSDQVQGFVPRTTDAERRRELGQQMSEQADVPEPLKQSISPTDDFTFDEFKDKVAPRGIPEGQELRYKTYYQKFLDDPEERKKWVQDKHGRYFYDGKYHYTPPRIP